MLSRWVILGLMAACGGLGCKQPEQPRQSAPLATPSKPRLSTDASALRAKDASAPRVKEQVNDLVDLRRLLPTLALDMRYASTQNFLGKAMYDADTCLLRRPAAVGLKRAQDALKVDGLELLVWDCYRPFSVQEAFWKHMPKRRYVAEPVRDGTRLVKGSKHNRGAAVDLTLKRIDGEILLMPTDHDDFSPRAHRPKSAKGLSAEAWQNAEKLRDVMLRAGFIGIESEWWHFDHESWHDYGLSDEPL